MKSSTYNFHTKTKILADFPICISVPLSINSIRKTFDDRKLIVNENVDILCIAETKIDESFPTAQFLLPGYKPYRLDTSDKQGGLLIYVKAHLPSRL